VTPAAKEARERLDKRGGAPPNAPPFSMSAARFVSEEEHLERQGVRFDVPVNREYHDLKKEISNFCSSDKRDGLTTEKCEEMLPKVRRFEELVSGAAELGIPGQMTKWGRELVYACAARIARATDLKPGSEAAEFAVTRLTQATGDASSPQRSEDQDEQWDRHMPGWGWPQSRTVAAEGLTALAAKPEFCNAAVCDLLLMLEKDVAPEVRYQVISRCISLYHTSPKTMWAIIRHAAANEERLAILYGLLEGALLRLRPSEVHDLVEQVYRRIVDRDAGEARGACAVFFVRRAIWEKEQGSAEHLERFLHSPLKFQPELSQIVSAVADLATFEEEGRDPQECEAVRRWTFAFYRRTTEASMAEVKSRLQRLTGVDRWPDEDQKAMQALGHLALMIVMNLRGAIGEEGQRLTAYQLKRFAGEAGEAIEALCEVPFAHIAYDLFDVLRQLSEADAPGALKWLHKSVMTARADAVQYEHLAATRIVEIVETYLARHRDLFREPGPQSQLLDILDTFVEAGWTEANGLTYRLSEVFR